MFGQGRAFNDKIVSFATTFVDDMHKAFLRPIVDEGPIPAVHGVVRWRASDLFNAAA